MPITTIFRGVARPPVEDAINMQGCLGDDFAGRQITCESLLPGCTKRATERAAGLRADTRSDAAPAAHQHGLDKHRLGLVVAGQPQQVLPGQSVA